MTCGPQRAENANLAGSEYPRVNPSGSRFDDVNLRDTVFENVSLTRSRIHNACLGDLAVEDANHAGMRIEGILVTELLRVYRESHPGGPGHA